MQTGRPGRHRRTWKTWKTSEDIGRPGRHRRTWRTWRTWKRCNRKATTTKGEENRRLHSKNIHKLLRRE